MLKNVSREWLVFLLILILIIAIVFIAVRTTCFFIKLGKINTSNKKKTILISIFSIILAAVSWITNMGWIRFIMTLMMIPFIHAIIFFITDLYIASYIDKYWNIKLLNLLFYITYLLLYIFLPDGGDVGELYFFFGLIHSNVLSYIAQAISGIAFLVHIVLLILQIIQVAKIKKKETDGI